METIKVHNVVKIKDGVISDEIFSSINCEEAEKKFVEEAVRLGYEIEDEEDRNYILDEGYYLSFDERESVCISTSFLDL